MFRIPILFFICLLWVQNLKIYEENKQSYKGGLGGGMNWEIGTDVFKPLFIK